MSEIFHRFQAHSQDSHRENAGSEAIRELAAKIVAATTPLLRGRLAVMTVTSTHMSSGAELTGGQETTSELANVRSEVVDLTRLIVPADYIRK